ncbi:MAG: hypothetical protein HOC22_05530 [Cryomorphaceae bacterium]|jgi:hypothetical protein|nr:hypothetical protein [Cryomorphaceae bacterium]MDG1888880.1 hypothetical protein [Flavobacteriaceae bacterium]MBT3689640.1 hypothetical protein [Cryomorphaceae bacterium]MBT4221642.1 hypothetical protein [Cryomorphaceae bacterium]MBT4293979.1 hypothetical protein [Cryomorphaceae bacterium]
MKKLLLLIFFLSISCPVTSQKYYDSNDLKYYIDFSNRNANLKFQDYKINGPIEEIISYYGNRYTVVRGDSIHWLLQQSDKRNKYLSYLIFKGNYGEVQKLAKWEYSNKKLEVLASDRIFSGYFKDYFNFVDEGEYLKISSDRLIGDYLKDAGLIGEYKIKIYRDNGVNYFDLEMEGVLKLTRKEVIIETNLPTLTRFVGTYDSNLNTNIEFLKKGIVAGKISFKDRAIFSLNIDSEKKMGTLTSLEVEVNKEGVEVNTRKTTTFLIKE